MSGTDNNSEKRLGRSAATTLLSASLFALSALPAQAAVPVATLPGAGSSISAFYLFGIELGPWEDYLLNQLTPDLSVIDVVSEPKISWFDSEQAEILPHFARTLLEQRNNLLMTFGYESQLDTSLVAGSFSQAGLSLRGELPGNRLQREFFSTGIAHQLSESSVLDVSAVFAYQRFSAPGLGFVAFDDPNPEIGQGPVFAPYQETAYGQGVRLALQSELTTGMSIAAGYQSRIDMDTFNNYRGVYSEPGDLDIPAKAHIGLQVKAGRQSSFTVGLDHVLYSDVDAFPAQFLPQRFVSLLGDSSSPTFAWEDLTVFSLGWRWQMEDTEWWVDVTTRQQPSPTSAVLSRVLSQDVADNAMLVGFSKRTSRNGRLNVTAAYAPPEYAFGGSVLGVTSENLDQTLELEALWIWNF